MDEISEWHQNLAQARHSLFLLDSCFSGLAGEQSKADEYIKVYMEDLLKPGHFLMTAGSAGQESVESLPRWNGSLFTDAFLRGASGAADSGTAEFAPDGVITLGKLFEYIHQRISAERTLVSGVNQTPLLSDLSPKSEGEFFFIPNPGNANPHSRMDGIIEVRVSPPEAALWLDGELKGPADGFRARIPPGPHEIEIRAQGYESRHEAVTIGAGREQHREFILAPDKTPVSPPPPRTTGTLELDVGTPGAVLTLDGKLVGPAKGFRQEVQAGTHVVEVSADGYEAQRQTIEISAGSDKVFVAN
jgi:hypothetical protein